MASRDTSPDRRAVFERDDSTCQLCGVDVDPEDATAYPIGPVDLEAAHPSRTATICESCLERVRGEAGEPTTSVAVFRTVRRITRTQGATVADAADFASQATSFPETLTADTVPPYAADRRRLLLAIEAVETDLETLEAADRSELKAGARVSLEDFTAVSKELQTGLESILELISLAAVAFGRCHVCFEVLEDGRADCQACGAEIDSLEEWRGTDGSVRFDALFGEISDVLVEASETTEEVARRTTVLAETLVE